MIKENNFESSQSNYFDLLGEAGLSQHPGGIVATKSLLNKINFDKNSLILDVGCGVGKTSVHIAKNCGCKIFGIDLSPKMVDKAKVRSKEYELTDLTHFEVANANNLPFDNDKFDVVIIESVISFTKDKSEVLNECYRVLKPGGFIGVNESTWLSEDLSPDLFNGFESLKPETPLKWLDLLKNSGFENLKYETNKVSPSIQFIDEIKSEGLTNVLKSVVTLFRLFSKNPPTEMALKRDTLKHVGYGIYIGEKVRIQ